MLLAAAVLIAFTLFEMAHITLSERSLNSKKFEEVKSAIRRDPANPALEYHIGGMYEVQEMNDDEAVAHFRRATMLVPNRAEYWSALARECFATGDRVCADEAFRNVDLVAPAVPSYQWQIANYFLINDNSEESLLHFKRFLELSREDPTPCFDLCLRAFTPEQIWSHVVRDLDRPEVKLNFISFLSRNGHTDFAYKLWKEAVANGTPIGFLSVQGYLEQLLAISEVGKAEEVWLTLERQDKIKGDEPGSANLIYNGGFELPHLGGGFDWRDNTNGEVSAFFADTSAYQGRFAARLDFNGGNNNSEPINHVISVEPNRQYLLKAEIKSEELTSDSGPRLVVHDPYCPGCSRAETESTVGTTPWHEVSTRYTAGPKTIAVIVSVVRVRGRSFPSDIHGHFWLDSVSLTPTAPAQ